MFLKTTWRWEEFNWGQERKQREEISAERWLRVGLLFILATIVAGFFCAEKLTVMF
jgi:hypothetical protein